MKTTKDSSHRCTHENITIFYTKVASLVIEEARKEGKDIICPICVSRALVMAIEDVLQMVASGNGCEIGDNNE